MRSVRFFIVLVLTCAFAFGATPAPAPVHELSPQEQVDRLDAIVSKAKDLNELLDSPELLNEYFLELQRFNGGPLRFQRESFDAIVAQLRALKEKVPEIGPRLWETNGLGKSFSVSVKSAGAGRKLNLGAFNDWFEDWVGYDHPPYRSGEVGEFEPEKLNAALSRLEELAELSREFTSNIEAFRKAPDAEKWRGVYPFRSALTEIEAEKKQQAETAKVQKKDAIADRNFGALDKNQIGKLVKQAKAEFNKYYPDGDSAGLKLELDKFAASPGNPEWRDHSMLLQAADVLTRKALAQAQSKEVLAKAKERFIAQTLEQASDPIKRVASEYSRVESFMDARYSGDADNVFDAFDRLRDRKALDADAFRMNPALERFAKLMDRDPPPFGFEIAWKKAVPDADELKVDTRTFPKKRDSSGNTIEAGSGALLSFIRAPRRIHGVWGGIPLGECTGGGCKYLESVSEERWGLVALKDSQYHFTFEGNEKDGFVLAVPLDLNKDGKGNLERVASINLSSPMLKRDVRERVNGGKLVTRSIFEAIFPEYSKRKPKEWHGYILSNGNGSDNAGVLDTVRASDSYKWGKQVGTSRDLAHIDELAAKIVAYSNKQGHASDYSGRMMSEATIPTAGRLAQLIPYKSGYLEALSHHPKALESFADSLAPSVGAMGYLEVFVRTRKKMSDSNLDKFISMLSVPIPSQEMGFFISNNPPDPVIEDASDRIAKKLIQKKIPAEFEFPVLTMMLIKKGWDLSPILYSEAHSVNWRLTLLERMPGFHSVDARESKIITGLLKQAAADPHEVERAYKYLASRENRNQLLQSAKGETSKLAYDLLFELIPRYNTSEWVSVGFDKLLRTLALEMEPAAYVFHMKNLLRGMSPNQRLLFLKELNVFDEDFYPQNSVKVKLLRESYLEDASMLEFPLDIFAPQSSQSDRKKIIKKIEAALRSGDVDLNTRAARIFNYKRNRSDRSESLVDDMLKQRDLNSIKKLLFNKLSSANLDLAQAASNTLFFHKQGAAMEMAKSSNPLVRKTALSNLDIYKEESKKVFLALIRDPDANVAVEAINLLWTKRIRGALDQNGNVLDKPEKTLAAVSKLLERSDLTAEIQDLANTIRRQAEASISEKTAENCAVPAAKQGFFTRAAGLLRSMRRR